MKEAASIMLVSICLLFLAGTGCGPTQSPQLQVKPIPRAQNDSNELAIYSLYVPVRISIMPLTEIVSDGPAEKNAKIKAFVSLTDSFGCQQKTPGVFRFELYEHIQRAAESKGRRIAIWPDIDLTDPDENNKFWRDFLRAYEFNMDFELAAGQNYILQATCLCPNGKRLWADFVLKYAK